MDTIEIAEYTVRIGLRQDNPAFPCFIVFKGARLVGKQFSYPTLGDCRWLERSAQYAAQSEHASQPYGWTAETARRQGRNRKMLWAVNSTRDDEREPELPPELKTAAA